MDIEKSISTVVSGPTVALRLGVNCLESLLALSGKAEKIVVATLRQGTN